MSRAAVPRLLLTGSAVTALTSTRIGTRCAVLVAQRAPELVRLGVQSAAGTQSEMAQATFRDEFLRLARDAAELSWRQTRRGLDQLDLLTRPAEPSLGQPGPAAASRPHRRAHRVKP